MKNRSSEIVASRTAAGAAEVVRPSAALLEPGCGGAAEQHAGSSMCAGRHKANGAIAAGQASAYGDDKNTMRGSEPDSKISLPHGSFTILQPPPQCLTKQVRCVAWIHTAALTHT